MSDADSTHKHMLKWVLCLPVIRRLWIKKYILTLVKYQNNKLYLNAKIVQLNVRCPSGSVGSGTWDFFCRTPALASHTRDVAYSKPCKIKTVKHFRKHVANLWRFIPFHCVSYVFKCNLCDRYFGSLYKQCINTWCRFVHNCLCKLYFIYIR